MKKKLKRTFQIILLLVVLFIGFTLWPMKSFVRPKYLLHRNLILITNEFEARPCGGFLTAYGIARVWPFVFEVKNAYSLEQTRFGAVEFPLNRIADQKNFWDLGTSPDLRECGISFANAYQEATGYTAKNNILVSFAAVEDLMRTIGAVELGEETVTAENLFATLSRSVANVDRHSQADLSTRKKPLADLGKALIRRVVTRPYLWPQVTYKLRKHLHNGNIYVAGISPQIRPEEEDLSIIEWNLGGGKSSRFLRKNLRVRIRETAPEQWTWVVELTADHVGGSDEPLSQDWKGGFEVRFPKFLGQKKVFTEATIPPGELFRKVFTFQTTENPHELNIFVPRGQTLVADIAISAYPQQTLQSTTLLTRENTATTVQTLSTGRYSWTWQEKPDAIAPFVTLHELIPDRDVDAELRTQYPKANMWIEIHTNENTRLQPEGLFANLKDLDTTVSARTDHPVFVGGGRIRNDQTFLLGFTQKENFQPEESYRLTLTGLEDLWGHLLELNEYTVIDRRYLRQD